MIIAQNGIVKLPTFSSATSSLFLVSGEFDGGTLEIGYKDSGDNFIPFSTDEAINSNQQVAILHGTPVDIYANLTGANTPSVEVLVTTVSYS